MKFFFALPVLATLAFAGDRAGAQANVTENQSPCIYVDARLGSDANSGALSSPFKTVQAAVNNAKLLNQQGTGVKVIIDAGVYREFVNVGNYKTTSAPLTLQAAVAGTAIIADSDVLSGWSNSGGSFSKATLTSGVLTLTSTSNSTAVAQTVPITLFGTSGSHMHSATFI